MTSPGAFTLLFFALPLPRLFTLFLLPDGVRLSLSFLLSILLSLFLSAVSKSFPLDAFVYQLPAKVTEQQFSFTNCDLAGTLHLVYIVSSLYPVSFLFDIRGSSILNFTAMPELFYLVPCINNKRKYLH